MTFQQSLGVIPFSTRLVLMRVGHRLSQGQLAKETDIDQALLSRYENGLLPTEKDVKKLEGYFGIEFTSPNVEDAASVFCGVSQSESPCLAA